MKRILVLILMLIGGTISFSQGFSLSDTTIVFKDKRGNTLTTEQVISLMQQKFSMSTQNLSDGKKAITIIPVSESEQEQSNKEKEEFINNLLGKRLSEFSFEDMNDNKLESKSVEAKIIVMNFWFTGCRPCIAEITELNKLVSDYKGEEIVFIGVSFDTKQAIQKFITKRSFNYNLVADQKNYIDKMNITSYPVHIIANKEGIIKKVIVGFTEDTIKQLRDTIEKMILKKNSM